MIETKRWFAGRFPADDDALVVEFRSKAYEKGVYGWVDFTAWRTVACEAGTGKHFFQRAGSSFSPDCIESFRGAETLVSGHMKFDGCNEIEWGDHASHCCGVDDRRNQHALLELILRTIAVRIMGRRTWNVEPWPEGDTLEVMEWKSEDETGVVDALILLGGAGRSGGAHDALP